MSAHGVPMSYVCEPRRPVMLSRFMKLTADVRRLLFFFWPCSSMTFIISSAFCGGGEWCRGMRGVLSELSRKLARALLGGVSTVCRPHVRALFATVRLIESSITERSSETVVLIVYVVTCTPTRV